MNYYYDQNIIDYYYDQIIIIIIMIGLLIIIMIKLSVIIMTRLLNQMIQNFIYIQFINWRDKY